MCDEETATATEPSSPPPPVESTTKDKKEGGGSATDVLSDYESPVAHSNGSQGASTAMAPSLDKETASQQVYAGHDEALEVQQQPKGFIDIWADNETEGYRRLKELLGDENRKWYVAIDTEFCMKDGVLSPQGVPQSADAHYEQARRIVDEGDLVQVGFALVDSRSGLETESFQVFQFNICFDHTARSSTSTNIRFLEDVAKLNLADHATRGINVKNFICEIKGILGNKNIIWLTFQGYSDLGYLIRVVQNSCVLTPSRREFIRLAKGYFPSSYDLKLLLTLGIFCQKPSRGVAGSASLKGLASSLGVERSGEEHGSGSDAHLTLGCFIRIMLSDPAAASELRRYKNTIYGVENPLTCITDDNSDADHVQVWASDFDSQLAIISCSLHPLGCLLTAEVQLVSATINQPVVSYSQARAEASQCKADLALGFSDQFGRLAFGRIWIFHVQAQGAGDEEKGNRINPAKLAELLTRMKSLQNPNVSWLSSNRACYLYLVSVLTRCLPLEEQEFFALWNLFFPNSGLIEHRSPEEDPGRRAIITQRQMLGNSHFQ
ncbi:uncharacterized protein LOC123428910 [Hordeum vulgare subsp. vulgare]|uniref:uncharacterized protein LOC123428910 n=1 Tax=Hordeum vulgare subsp. vulgare TaxID=112509 RepID=UPI001D1A35A6|nr:uncharacterized protein LOC123428910 [Hordeum vulgare subsp. vulgare]